MFDITLLENDGGPLYRQLYLHIRTLITNNELQDGVPLPSIRSLMQQSHLSKTTIETAYHMLIEEGYALSKPRSGLYVINPRSYQAQASSIKNEPYTNQVTNDGNSDVHVIPNNSNNKLIDFHLLAIDENSFPVQAWRSALNETLSMPGALLQQYGVPKGEYNLRQQLAHYLKNARGVACLPEQIIIGTGLSYSIQILKGLLDTSRKVAFEESGIAQVEEKFTQHGFKLIPYPLQEDCFPAHRLVDERIHTLYVTPSHRSSGHPLSYSLRQQMLHWAYQNNAYIIEDDYDGEFRYQGKTIPSLQGLDERGAVIYIGTFSKAFSPALRMNYMVLPPQLMVKLNGMEHILSSPSRIDQLAMGLFMKRGHWYRHIRRMRNLYRKKHEALTGLIHIYFADQVQIEGDNAGLHIELTVKTTSNAEELIQLAAANGVQIYSPQNKESHPRNSDKHPKIYLGFGRITVKDMERGIQLIKEAWSRIL